MDPSENIRKIIRKIKVDPKEHTERVLRDSQTKIDLTDIAQEIRGKYANFGLENILSAGLVLFEKQTEDDQVAAIFVAKGIIEPDFLDVGAQRLQRINDAVSLIKKFKKQLKIREKSSKVIEMLKSHVLQELETA